MRVVVFGSGGPLSQAALQAIRAPATPVAVVVPDLPMGNGPRPWVRAWLDRRARRPFARAAEGLGVPVVRWRRGRETDLLAALRALAPDLVVVASFPRLLPAAFLALGRLGAIGLHASLLPRHRGPSPLYWTYVHDDTEAGISLFRLDGGEDTGPVLAASSLPLPRGLSVEELYSDLAARGRELLEAALGPLAAGAAAHTPQDPARATRDPRPRPGDGLDRAEWGAERLWHVLSGLGNRHRFLADGAGRRVAHGRATGFVLESHGRPPGTLERAAGGWRLYCRDGVVDVAAAPWWRWRGIIAG